jgi:hypothetical protein
MTDIIGGTELALTIFTFTIVFAIFFAGVIVIFFIKSDQKNKI